MKILSSLYKTVAIFGANGRTGREATYYSLLGGYNTVAFARNYENFAPPDRTQEFQPKMVWSKSTRHLHSFYGDVNDEEDVEEFMKLYNPDAAIIALGGEEVDSATANIIKYAPKKCKLVAVTSIGVGDSKNYPPFFFKILKSSVLKKMFDAKVNQEELLENSMLKYTIVRPSGLTNENPVTKNELCIITNTNYENKSRTHTIPRSNVAMCALDNCFDPSSNKQIINIEQV